MSSIYFIEYLNFLLIYLIFIYKTFLPQPQLIYSQAFLKIQIFKIYHNFMLLLNYIIFPIQVGSYLISKIYYYYLKYLTIIIMSKMNHFFPRYLYFSLAIYQNYLRVNFNYCLCCLIINNQQKLIIFFLFYPVFFVNKVIYFQVFFEILYLILYYQFDSFFIYLFLQIF